VNDTTTQAHGDPFPFAIRPLPEGQENPAAVEPLKWFAPHGEIVALSFDGGKTFHKTAKGREEAPTEVARDYKFRVLAAIPTETPAVARRVLAPFSAFAAVGIQAGWGDPLQLVELGAKADVLVVPGLAIATDFLGRLRELSGKIVLDIDEPLPGDTVDKVALAETAAVVDMITVPSGRMRQELLKHHTCVYEVPPVIDAGVWKGMTRDEPGEKLRIGVTNPTANPALALAVQQVYEALGDKVEVVPYDWWELGRTEERPFYRALDIAVVGDMGPFNTAYPALAAAAGGCAIVGGRGYGKAIKHGHNGRLVGLIHDHKVWRREIADLVVDQRRRRTLGRNARNEVRKQLAGQNVSVLTLPYKLLAAGRV
jgi:hypothetical protein